MRQLSDAFIEAYLDAEWPEVGYTVGVFRLEGRGVQMFDAIDGDHFTILGMSLLPFLRALRERGLLRHDQDCAHRLDRHGEVDRRGDVRAPPACRYSMPMPSSASCRAGGGSVDTIGELFPARSRWRHARPRQPRRTIVLGDRVELAALEQIVHPAVTRARAAFIDRPRGCAGPHVRNSAAVRNTAKRKFDKVIVVSAPAECSARGCSAPRHDRGQARLDPRRARCPTRRSAREPISSIDTGGDLSTTEARSATFSLVSGRGGGINSPVREIVFDTETTGLNPAGGDRMVEIGCVEIVNRVETGRHFHAISIPSGTCRSKPKRCTGSATFLSDKPRFSEKAEELLEFIGDSPLVAHNAGFDFGFLNFELERCGRPACASAEWSTR